MDALRIKGGVPLHGTVEIGGAKNAALPLMAACLLTEKPFTLSNVPHLSDISTMANLLIHMGVDFSVDGCAEEGGHIGRVLTLKAKNVSDNTAPYDIVRKMRASVVVMGPLLARYGYVRVSLPGGCAIGPRPIDLHIKAFEKMNATIQLEDGYVTAHAKNGLKGADITFPKVSVGATENVLMAATLAKGRTVIRNAACEPEISDLAACLVQMGAKIEGIGSDTLTIEGVETLSGTQYSVLPDRIESGTYAVAAAITGGELELIGADIESMGATIEQLEQAGVAIEATENGIRASRKSSKISPLNVATAPYPGFATDMQAQLMALMCVADGTSTIAETIFENRFMHISELMRMGADISVEGHTATVRGVKQLKGAEVMATDLRASVSLVLAALVAEGITQINRVYHIDRGYERIEEKLAQVGAQIERVQGG